MKASYIAGQLTLYIIFGVAFKPFSPPGADILIGECCNVVEFPEQERPSYLGR